MTTEILDGCSGEIIEKVVRQKLALSVVDGEVSLGSEAKVIAKCSPWMTSGQQVDFFAVGILSLAFIWTAVDGDGRIVVDDLAADATFYDVAGSGGTVVV